MTLRSTAGSVRPRRRLWPTLLAALALSASVLGAAHAVPPDRAEDDPDIGPRNARVHPGYDTVAHARASVRARRPPKPPQQHAGHAGHGSRTTSTATGTTGTGETAGTAAAAVTLEPEVFGRWETLSYDLPLRAVHATALKNGKVLLIAGSGNSSNDNLIANFRAHVLDPVSGALTSVPVPYDAFCAFHVVDGNGDVLVFGGTQEYKSSTSGWVGSNKAYKFVVDTNSWQAMPPMKHGRWYPGGAMDGDGKVYAYSGRDGTGAIGKTPEMYDPATRTWTTLATRDLPMYAGLHTAKDGRLLYSGAHYGPVGTAVPTAFHPVTGAKVDFPGSVLDLSHRNMAMSALVGSADEQLVWVAGGGFPAVDTSYFIDIDAATPAAVAGPALPAPKSYVSLSNLPDLTTLETGGGAGFDSPVFETSLLQPSSRTLLPMAPHTVPRTYHSSSLTTRDGRVLTFGGDPGGAANFVLKVEVFSPPYLFAGPRPTITTAPARVGYGGTYSVTAAAATDSSLQYATLLRPGSATHSADSNQRGLRLSTRVVAGGVEITLPTNRNLAPPGWYFLSVVDAHGRPSVSEMVHLSPDVTGPPPPDTTAPTVTSRTPSPGATGVGLNDVVTATFSEAVSGVSSTTFTLRSGATSVPASVSYLSGTARLVPAEPLLAGTTYTAALTGGIKDSADHALVPVEWTFTTAAAGSATRTIVVPAEADTMVKQANPSSAYGGATTLQSDAQDLSTTGSAVHSYVRFDVTGLQTGETVTGAQLSLQSAPTDGGTTNGPAVWRTANTGTLAGAESMTWNTGRPARTGSAPVGNAGAIAHGVRFDTPVSGVTSNGVVSFELAPEVKDGLLFRSSEYATTGDRPQLVLTVRAP